MPRTHYETLGVPHTATDDEIVRAYRELALKYHPDRGGDAGRFSEIALAKEVLSDESRRWFYDWELTQAEPTEPSSPRHSPSSSTKVGSPPPSPDAFNWYASQPPPPPHHTWTDQRKAPSASQPAAAPPQRGPHQSRSVGLMIPGIILLLLFSVATRGGVGAVVSVGLIDSLHRPGRGDCDNGSRRDRIIGAR